MPTALELLNSGAYDPYAGVPSGLDMRPAAPPAEVSAKALRARARSEAVRGREGSANRIRNGVYDFLRRRLEPETTTPIMAGMDMLPGIGDAAGVEDTWQAARSGDWKATTLLGAATLAGVVPGVPGTGPLAKKARKVATETPSIRGLTLDEALPTVRKQVHLIPKEGGGYVGAPQWVKGPKDLKKLRARIDETVEAGSGGASWYDRARAANREMTGGVPQEMDWAAAQHALYSAQRDPGAEFGHVLEDLNTAIASGGVPTRTNTPVQTAKTTAAYAAGDPAALRAGLGNKTREYEAKINPNNAFALQTGSGVNDLWHGRLFGYDQESTFSPQAHTFMDYETALAADRANKRASGGMTDWSGAKVQASPWVQLKGEGLYEASKKRLHADAREELGKGATAEAVEARARELAFAEGNRTQADFLDKYTAFATNEPQPYIGAGHLPGLAGASPEERLAFASDPRSSWATAPGGRDTLYAETRIPGGPGMRVRPSLQGQGVYTPPGGETEFNPVNISRPLVAIKEAAVEPGSRALLDTAEALRGYVDVQGATPWHKPIASGKPGEQNAFFAELGRSVTPEELTRAQEIGSRYALGDVIDTGQGLTFTNFEGREALKPGDAKALLREMSKAVPGVSGGERVKIDSGYPGYEGSWEAGEGSGAATKLLLERLGEQPAVAAALDVNPGVPRAALDRLERDEALSSVYGATRKDIQNARRIIGEGPGWHARLQAALKNGAVLPAIALPLLGVVPWSDEERGQ